MGMSLKLRTVVPPGDELMRISDELQELELVLGGEMDERGAKALNALSVDVCEAGEKLPLCFLCFGREKAVYEAIHQSLFCPRRIGPGNDQVAQRNQGFVLVRIEECGFPVGAR